jgi:MFS family permease
LPRLQAFSSLQYRDYRYLWTGTLFASAGNWIQQITLAWLLYEITGNAFLVGVLQGARTLPFLVTGPVAGVLTDRVDRRKLLIYTQVFLALLALSFALLILLDLLQVWHFFVFAFLSGGGQAFNNPVRQSLVANTVPREALLSAVALQSSAFNVNRILGPSVGGILIALFGPGTNFLVQAVCFSLVAVAVFPIRVRKEAGPAATPRHLSTFSSLLEGIEYVRGEQTILALIVITMIPSVFIMPFTTGLMPVFAKDVLKLGPEGLGMVMAAFGAGALIAPMVLVSFGNMQRRGLILFAGGVVSALGIMAFSQTTFLALAMPVIAVVGGGQMVYHTLVNTEIHTITPDEFRGRVMSLYMMDHGLVPLGSILAGALAQTLGSPTAILIGGSMACGLILAAMARFRTIRALP